MNFHLKTTNLTTKIDLLVEKYDFLINITSEIKDNVFIKCLITVKHRFKLKNRRFPLKTRNSNQYFYFQV